MTLVSPWVETQDEAEAWARLELKILLAYPVTLRLAWPIPVLDVGQSVEIIGADELGFQGRILKVWEHGLVYEGTGGRVAEEVVCLIDPEL